ncbi:GTP cyclohydrolase II RibA, partial [Vibrio maritimus]
MEVRQKVIIPITEREVAANFYSFDGFDKDNEHLLIEVLADNVGPKRDPLLRIHSECLTGDVFFSARCDCGSQLQEALEMISIEGGYIAYLRQEGRGIGLYNKLDAYKVQDSGLDTYDANLELGFGIDNRDFGIVANMLKCIGIDSVRLVTNNPKKPESLRNGGIVVSEVIKTSSYVTKHN